MTTLNTTTVNQVPYLRTTREFPEEPKQLVQEISKSYLDIANAVNSRVIGIYPINRPAITGKNYFVFTNPSLRVNQSLRQVYLFTSVTTNPILISHGIKFSDIAQFSEIYGTAFDGTLYYPLPFVDETLVTNQISVKIDSTNIIITLGATAPAITSGLITLEWLVN
jgi:hypothetical protein